MLLGETCSIGRTLRVRDSAMGHIQLCEPWSGSHQWRCIELNARSSVIVVMARVMAGGVAQGVDVRQQKQTILIFFKLTEFFATPLQES